MILKFQLWEIDMLIIIRTILSIRLQMGLPHLTIATTQNMVPILIVENQQNIFKVEQNLLEELKFLWGMTNLIYI